MTLQDGVNAVVWHHNYSPKHYARTDHISYSSNGASSFYSSFFVFAFFLISCFGFFFSYLFQMKQAKRPTRRQLTFSIKQAILAPTNNQ